MSSWIYLGQIMWAVEVLCSVRSISFRSFHFYNVKVNSGVGSLLFVFELEKQLML